MFDIYGKHGAEAFLNSASLVNFMGSKSETACNYVSAILGERDFYARSKSFSNPLPGEVGGQATVNETINVQKRKVMEPWEVRQNLGEDDQITIMKGVSRPIWSKKIPYWKTGLAELAGPNPFAPGASSTAGQKKTQNPNFWQDFWS